MVWTPKTNIKGATPVIATTSATSNTIGTGTKTFALATPTAWQVGDYIRASSTATPSNYVGGAITAVSSTSVTLSVTDTTGTGTPTSWNLALSGARGAAGSTGATPSLTGTSTSSHTITTGTKTFTTQSGKAWVVGMRLRASYTTDPAGVWLEGVVTTYSTTTLTLTVDKIKGSGTQANWTINLAGEPGIDGPQGIQGIQGEQGIPGKDFVTPDAVSIATTLAPAEDIPVITYSTYALDASEKLVREKRIGGSSTNADIAGDTNFLYGGTFELVAHGANPTQYVTNTYLTGGATQAARFQFRVRTTLSGSNYIKFRLRMGGTSVGFRIKVDGAWVTPDLTRITDLTAGGTYLVTLTFPTTKTRVIEYEDSGSSTAFGGVVVPSTATTARPSEWGKKFLAIGDSLTGGSGAPPNGATRMETWAAYVAKALGFEEYINYGIGGRGYVTGKDDAEPRNFVTSTADAVAYNPDTVVVFGSRNDSGGESAELQAQVTATLAGLSSIRNVYVVGCVTSGFAGNNRSIKAAADAAGRPFIDPVALKWVNNDTTDIGSDGVHPTYVGHQKIARGMYAAIQKIVTAGNVVGLQQKLDSLEGMTVVQDPDNPDALIVYEGVSEPVIQAMVARDQAVEAASSISLGTPDGVAQLDSGSKLRDAQVPARLNLGTGSAFTRKRSIDPRDYGAVGDGTTDDYDAIVAAVNAWRIAVTTANGRQPGELFFPSGYRFAVSQPVVIAPTLGSMTGGSIVGHGAELLGLTPMDYVLKIDSSGTNAYWRHWALSGINLRNGGLLIKQNADLTDNLYAWSVTDVGVITTGLGHGISVENAYEGKIDTPKISHAGGTEFSGISVTGNASSMELIGGVVRRGKYGVFADGTDLDIFGTTTLNSDNEGFRIMNAKGNVLSGVHAERVQASKTSLTGHQPAIYAEGAITVSGAYVYDTSVVADRRITHAVSVYATSTGSPFIMGAYSSNIPTQVRANGASGSTVSILGALSYELVTTTVGVTKIGGGTSGGLQVAGSFIDVKRANGTDPAIRIADSSTTTRLSIDALGAMSWAGFGTAADTTLNRPSANTLAMGAGDDFRVDGTWNGGRLRMGNYYFWVDANGALRSKSSAPTSDTDGNLV